MTMKRPACLAAIALLPFLAAQAAADNVAATHHVRLTLRSTPDADARAALEKAGLELLDPLAPGVYFARADAAIDAAVLKALGATAEPIAAADKLHRLFQAPGPGLAPAAPEWAALGENALGEPMTAAIVLLHEDEPLGAAAATLIARHGGVVRTEFLSVRGVFAELPTGALAALAGEDAVRWIEPPIPALQPANADARARMQVDTLQTAPYDLTGAGVEVFVYDGGLIRATHLDLLGRVAHLDQSGTDSHASHVAGIIAGDGHASGGMHRGMAPDAYLFSAGVASFGAPGGPVALHTNPGDIEADYAAAHGVKAAGRLIANNSLSSNISANGYDCEFMGDYGATSNILDAMVNGSMGEPMVIVWGGGNERGSGRCPQPYYTTPPPATAKNPIIVGAINSNDDSMTTFSSFGPTDDGRLAPVVVAPGCQSDGDMGITSINSASDTGYTVKCGTSMATPAVSGVVALLLQDWRAQYPSLADPFNATVKVILAHTAVDLGNPGPDYMHGYGSVRAQSAVDFLRSGNVATGSLAHAQIAPYAVTVEPGTSTLKFTLAWDDAPATPGAPIMLVNDLDLVVTDPAGVRHYPWTLDPADPAAPAVRTVEDHLNNIEQVVVDAPMAGAWTVQVAATNIPAGSQSFSLASSVDLNLPAIQINLPEGIPEVVAPTDFGGPTQIPVRITAQHDVVDAASPVIAYRLAGTDGPFTTVPLAHVSGDEYLATIPDALCGPDLEVFFAAAGLSGSFATNPAEAPAVDGSGPVGPGHTYAVRVGEYETRFYDSFDTDTGWEVENISVSDGGWERGVPVGGGTRADPPVDAEGWGGGVAGACWLTGNRAGNSDLDGGPTILTSPVLDASGVAEARLSYWRWYNTATGSAPLEDPFYVEVSSDDGATWTLLEEVAAGNSEGSGGWRFARFDLHEVVPLTDSMRIRFIAHDIGTPSVLEAAVDSVKLEVFICGDPVPPCLCELTGDDTVDVFDLLAYLDSWFAAAPAADLDGNEAVDVFDLLSYLDCWFAACP